MAKYALLNTTVIRGRNIVAGSIIDTIQEPSAKESLESKGGRLAILPNADIEAAAVIAQERRRYGASIQELDSIMTATAALTGANTVTSIFGRTGAVVAAASDYDASQIDNDSVVPGASVKAALDTLAAASAPVSSVFGRVGAVAAQAGDYSSFYPPNTRSLTAGAGLTGGGDLSADRTVNVVGNADGSITVNADDIQVGTLASDAQHGSRGGGTQHAVATTSVAGFESAADKTKLDGIATGAAALTASAPVNVTKAAAAVGVGTTAARHDHKHDVTTAAPSSVGTANSEGTAASLARSDHVHSHGSQSTATHHAVATTGANGFMSSTDKTKLDGVQSGAQVNTVTSVFGRTGAVTAQVGDYSTFFLQLSGGTMTGDLNMGDQDITAIKSASYNDEHNIGNSGTSFSIDWRDGNKQVVSLNGNVTGITFSNAPFGATSLMLRVKQTGSFTIAGSAWPASVKWVNGGAAPTITTGSGAEDVLAFLYNSDSEYDGVQSPNFV